MRTEKVLERVKNLLDLANNNPNEHEAMAAALKAQELMAKYNLNIADVEDENPQEIHQSVYHQDKKKHCMKKWKWGLSQTIAKNFCCKVYARGADVVFYGYKRDTEIAVEVFKFLFENGNKMAVRYYNKCKKEGKNTKGIMNDYLIGFSAGVKDALDKQCTALMIVTPKEVEESYAEFTKNFRTKHNKITCSGNLEARQEGRQDGRNAAEARQLSA